MHDYQFLVVSCFNAALPLVSERALEALQAHDMRRRFRVTESDVSTDKIYVGAPTPGGAHPKSALFYAPTYRPDSTVLFANMEDGWWTLINAVTARLQGTHAQVRITQSNVTYPMFNFEVWEDCRSRRAVTCTREDTGKWSFTEVGEPMPFENCADYKKRRIADRLTRQGVLGYLMALGWDISNKGFWTSERPGIYLTEIATQA